MPSCVLKSWFTDLSVSAFDFAFLISVLTLLCVVLPLTLWKTRYDNCGSGVLLFEEIGAILHPLTEYVRSWFSSWSGVCVVIFPLVKPRALHKLVLGRDWQQNFLASFELQPRPGLQTVHLARMAPARPGPLLRGSIATPCRTCTCCHAQRPAAVSWVSSVSEPGGGFSRWTFLSHFKYTLKTRYSLLCVWSRGGASRCLLAAWLWLEDLTGQAPVWTWPSFLCVLCAAASSSALRYQSGTMVTISGPYLFPEWECFPCFTVR